jgi:hypothetical protein
MIHKDAAMEILLKLGNLIEWDIRWKFSFGDRLIRCDAERHEFKSISLRNSYIY